jgi:hypothetical protein
MKMLNHDFFFKRIHKMEESFSGRLLVADGRLSCFRTAVLVKSIPEQRGNLRGFSSFDLVPLEQEQRLPVPKQTD